MIDQTIEQRIEQLKEAQQKRVNTIVEADPIWAHIGGQLEALQWVIDARSNEDGEE